MDMDMAVRCVCGHRIGLNELLAHGFVMVGDKPAHVYLKYRCAACDYEGLELLDYERWNSMLKDSQPEEETSATSRLGRITAGEILQFAQGLSKLTETELAELQS